MLQGDSFAYLPEKTGNLDSYAALFDPKWKGYVALEDNYTTAGQKTALYLKLCEAGPDYEPGRYELADEVKTVINFLIDQKKKGQFRVIWSSFQQAVDLIVNKEVYVIDCWEPMVFVAKSKGKSTPSTPTRKRGICFGRWRPTSRRIPNRSLKRRRPPTSFSTSCWAAGTAEPR